MNKEYPKKIADNVTMYAADPILYVVDNFLSNDECDAFIKASEGKLQPSTVINLDNELQHENRTSENCWIEHDANDMVHEVSKRLSILVQIPIRNAEQYQLVYYKKGAKYMPHFDSFDYETEDGKKYWEPGGQRMITVIAYLNDVEEGGETGFPKLDINIPPKKGDVVVFHNCIEGTTEINPDALHAGSPVVSGEKWAVNLWFRESAVY